MLTNIRTDHRSSTSETLNEGMDINGVSDFQPEGRLPRFAPKTIALPERGKVAARTLPL